MELIPLCCPECKGTLAEEVNVLYCKKCNKYFSAVDGIPSFTNDTHYLEDKWSTDTDENIFKSRWDKIKRSLGKTYNCRRYQFFQRQFLHAEKGVALDIGCGSGNPHFKMLGSVVGVDVSLPALKNAKVKYNKVIHCNVTKLPFPDKTFDYVISSDLIEHLNAADQRMLIQEMHRVLKDNGGTFHTAQTYGFFRNWARKKSPCLYQKYFVDMYGHIGMFIPSEILNIFRESGFYLTFKRKSNSMLFESYLLLKLLDNEYINASLLIKAAVQVLRNLSRDKERNSKIIRFFRLTTDYGIGILSDIIDIFTPFDWGNIIYVSFGKIKMVGMRPAEHKD